MDGDKESVRFFGFGEYVGDEVPPPEINPILNIGRPNPKIVLDNGKVVWGCECWWGPEAKIHKMLEGKIVINVDIDNARGVNAPEGENHEFPA